MPKSIVCMLSGIVFLLSMAGAPQAYADIIVPTGSDPAANGAAFQTALNNAQPGESIILTAGASYNTSVGFTLSNKGSGVQFVTILSSELDLLPAAGYRVHPADAPHMPKLVAAANAVSVIYTSTGAHHYRFIGIEFAEAPGIWAYDMLKLGNGSETTAGELPHDLEFDRCYAHGDPAAGTKRAFAFNAASLTVKNSYVSEIHSIGQDSQAICGWNGPGPFTIVNNYLEAAGENIMFGGATASIPSLIPSDIIVRNNHVYKPLGWKTPYSQQGSTWSIKNLLELKNAQRVTIDGNIMENCWTGSQHGYGLVFTVRTEGGAMPWAVVKNVQVTRNIIRHVATFMELSSTDDNGMGYGGDITFRDNVLEDINSVTWNGSGWLFLILGGPDNLTIDHNTGFMDAADVIFDGTAKSENFVYQNNLTAYGVYGVKGSGTGSGTSALSVFVSTPYIFTNNVMAGTPDVSGYYPPNNYFPEDWVMVQFVNFNSGSGGDYHLLPGSTYYHAGTDGKDIGADIDAVNAATCGVILGTPSCDSPQAQQQAESDAVKPAEWHFGHVSAVKKKIKELKKKVDGHQQ